MKVNEYETIFILRPDLGDDAVDKAVERIRGAVALKQGAMLRDQSWGRRRLAYDIKRNNKGLYHYLHYAGPAGIVEEVERTIKMVEPIIKFQTVRLNADIDIEKRRIELQKEVEEEERRRHESQNKPEVATEEHAEETDGPDEELVPDKDAE